MYTVGGLDNVDADLDLLCRDRVDSKLDLWTENIEYNLQVTANRSGFT